MAIGFNLPGIPGQIRGTAEEAGAVPDLSQAMIKGFRSNVENVQGYPRLLAQQLVSNQLANTINRAKAKYAEPMAKTSYDQALANLQHQGLINQYYGRMRESELASAGLSQEHQRMANEQARMKLSLYKDAYNAFKNMGATHDQAHNAAVQQVQQQAPQQGALREPYVPEFAAMLTGKNMPEYLSSIAPEQQAAQSYADSLMLAPEQPQGYTPLQPNLFEPQYSQRSMELGMPVESMLLAPELAQGYTPAQQNLFEPSYSQRPMEMQLTGQRPMAMELRPEEQAMAAPEYLQRPMEMELTEGMPARMPAPQQAQEQPVSYAQQLQQAGFNTDNVKPGYAEADELYMKSPLHRKILEEMSPGTGIKTYNDFPRNRQITTMTLPSGATKTTIQSLGGAQGAAADFKAQSPFGKANEDLRHYMSIGDLESARMAKQALDNMLNKDKKTQTEYDKSYKEWENAVDEFGPDSQKAKDYRARIESLNRGSVIRNEPRPPSNATMIYDENKNYIGYEVPRYTETQVKEKISPVGFKELFPYVSEGVKPYQGTLGEVNAQIENDIKNQDIDQAAANRLSNWLIAGKLLTSTASREIGMLNAPKVKNVLSSLREALGPTNLPAETLFPMLAKKYKAYESRINKAIQNDAQDKFGIINNMVLDKLQKAREAAEEERKFVPTKKTVNLSQKISQGAKTAQTQKKSKPIKMTPNAKGELEIVNG